MISNRISHVALAVFVLIITLTGNPAAAEIAGEQTRTASPPNVVIIFMDDLGYGDTGFNGALGYHTPNLNALAAQGMRFTNFYAAQPVCSASRAAILTGCYPNRIGISGALNPAAKIALNPEESTIASILKEAGYSTAAVGKWHLGSKAPYFPTRYGFDEYLGLPYSNDMWPVGYDGKPVPEKSKKNKYPPLPLIDGDKIARHIETLDDQGDLTGIYTERACDFIRRSHDKPFFLYLAHSMVHVPLAASPEFRGKSGVGLYGDVMMEVDWSVGEVMRTLHEVGATSNTLLVFTSDNGPWLRFGNHAGNTAGLREGKGTTFEGGVRVPCVMRWPGKIPAASVCNRIATTMDLLPTIAQMCGAPMPEKKIDGVDIRPLLNGDPDAKPRNEFAYYYGKNNLEAIRQGQWKLVFPHRSRTNKTMPPGRDGFPAPDGNMQVELALYDMATDPGETLDVQSSNPQVLKSLQELADKYRQDLGDDLQNVKGSGRREPARL